MKSDIDARWRIPVNVEGRTSVSYNTVRVPVENTSLFTWKTDFNSGFDIETPASYVERVRKSIYTKNSKVYSLVQTVLIQNVQ